MVDEEKIMNEWERGWIFTEMYKLVTILDILKKKDIREVSIQFTKNGCYIRKIY